MSGAIFAPLEGPGALDAASGHPLVCPLCHAQYERPCLLDCFHDFCAGCLRGRATDGRLACPLCQHQTVLKGPSGLPPVDRLLQFLVDGSGDGMEVARTEAHSDTRRLQFPCGRWSGSDAPTHWRADPELCLQDAETTYFCNTCGQPLCARCRDETHRARMFARHDIVALGQRSRDVLQKCSECGVRGGSPGRRWALPGALTAAFAPALHAEPYIMFSTDKKSLLCICCFRDMQGWVEGVGGERARGRPGARLTRRLLAGRAGPTVWTSSRPTCRAASGWSRRCWQPAPQAVKALQTATREAITLLQAMVEEVRRSAAEEEAAIHALFGSMQDKLAERKALLLQAVQSQYAEKDKAFKEQLSHLATLLPTLQLGQQGRVPGPGLRADGEAAGRRHAAASPPAGAEQQGARAAPVGRGRGPRGLEAASRPRPAPQITSDHRAEFARCLEPLLLLGPRRAAGAGAGTNTLAGGSGPKVLMGPSCPSPVGQMLKSPVQKPTLHRSISTKVLLAEGEDTPFTEHCRHYEDSYRRLQVEMQNLKDQVQELHRDLTKHHSLIKAEIMGDILHKSLQVDAQIASEYASVEGMRAVFQEIWEESCQRVANEQEIYEAQLHDLLQLKQENAYLTTITKQITPYVHSIAKVKERLEPRFLAPGDERSEHPQNMYDSSVSGETQARNDPVSVMDKREKTSEPRGNSRTPNSLTEEPPLKNKDPHRPKPRNGGDVPTRRERPT
ncbi:hypothetical protein HPG69_006993 [Diceros bicornis minor]|uniref:RING finger protein 207 n=1 Tax=Diceros bicornis minor TaxID=77932 RepID=A0A7J7ENQ3_DICBM|nr:hypothetical protein HPG69_006993 [Diceros bicornis minor]